MSAIPIATLAALRQYRDDMLYPPAADSRERRITMIDALLAGAGRMDCRNCGGGGWVCENHLDRPWEGTSAPGEGCDCGAGAPCPVCNLRMAAATYSEPWRELAMRAISYVADAEKDTNWGQPTFGPTFSEALEQEATTLANPSNDEVLG